jgi:hypothetical protein
LKGGKIRGEIEELRRKEKESLDGGDLSRATCAKIIADFLEEYAAGV